MGILIKVSLLVVCLCVLQVYGYDEEDKYKRTLEALKLLQREPTRRHVNCVGVGVSCDAVIHKCCGSAQCYWERGYSMRTKGKCVTCVHLNGKCQRNGQCCEGLQCEKGNALWLDGDCRAKRTSGHCYQDSQCQTDCKKKWWAFTGECE